MAQHPTLHREKPAVQALEYGMRECIRDEEACERRPFSRGRAGRHPHRGRRPRQEGHPCQVKRGQERLGHKARRAGVPRMAPAGVGPHGQYLNPRGPRRRDVWLRRRRVWRTCVPPRETSRPEQDPSQRRKRGIGPLRPHLRTRRARRGVSPWTGWFRQRRTGRKGLEARVRRVLSQGGGVRPFAPCVSPNDLLPLPPK